MNKSTYMISWIDESDKYLYYKCLKDILDLDDAIIIANALYEKYKTRMHIAKVEPIYENIKIIEGSES